MHTRFEKMSERLEMLRDLSQKKKKKVSWKKLERTQRFRENGSGRSLMILKVFKSLGVL